MTVIGALSLAGYGLGRPGIHSSSKAAVWRPEAKLDLKIYVRQIYVRPICHKTNIQAYDF